MNTQSPSDANVDTWVIATSADGHRAHVYGTEKDALLGAATFRTAAGVEYFDVAGVPLTARTGAAGDPQALQPAGAPAADLVRDRLHAIVGRVPEVARQHPERVAEHLAERGITLEEFLAGLPRLGGTDLPETLRRCQSFLGPHEMDDGRQHSAGFWHNLLVHGI
jgi:hypothetical protein